MGYVVIDLEFNNTMEITKYYSDFYEENPNLLHNECPNEIIQIGAVKLDKHLNETDRIMMYISLSILPLLNPRITEITGITTEDLKEGIPFIEALEQLKNFVGEDSVICSWAKDDIAEIIRNANYYSINEISWIKEYIDLQEYSTKVLGEKKPLSLKNALERLKIKLKEEKLHDALNDALYTVEVFKRLYNGRVIKEYIITDILNMPAIAIKNYDNIVVEEEKIDIKCPRCKCDVNIEYPLRLFNWRFVSLCNCKKCKSKILTEIIIKKTLSGDKVYKVNRAIINEMEYINYAYRFKEII